MLKENLARLKLRIADACARINKDADKITLLCVTKGRSVSQIKEAAGLGLKNIGENRVKEALEKFKEIPGVSWHMIGHLQSNKVKEAVRIFDLIHSVDSLALAEEIDKHAAGLGKIQDVLLEVKTSPEAAKFGILPFELAEVHRQVIKLRSIKVKGLMTMAPLVSNQEEARPCFAKLKQLRNELNPQWVLSMGMSDDFEVAIEEGADIIRLGRAIFEG